MPEQIAKYPQWPQIPPLYAIDRTWMENMEAGPQFTAPYPKRSWPESSEWMDFLGFPVASPLGIAAGPLLDSRWIECAAQLGFDVLTYKTISASARASHPLPNILFLDIDGQLSPRATAQTVYVHPHAPSDLEAIAITNSFGNPCREAEFLRRDIARARSILHEGQVLSVSIFGTGDSMEELASAYVRAARLAVESGAMVIEANLSCPNVGKSEGALYLHPEAITALGNALTAELGDTPLILKMGVFPSQEEMRTSILAAAGAGVRALAGINTVMGQILDAKKLPALGAARPHGGICGTPIRSASLQFARDASQIIEQDKLDLTLIGVGGMSSPEHFQEMLDQGAQFVQCATGMMWDPYLAARSHSTIFAGVLST